MKNAFILLIVFFLIGLKGISQNAHLVDSLKKRLINLKYSKAGPPTSDGNDTLIVHTLNSLSEAYWSSDPYQAIDYAQQTLELSTKIEYKVGIGSAYHSLGSVYTNLSDNEKAIDYFKQSLAIRKEIGNPKNIAATYLNLGVVYWHKGNYAEALKLDLIALRMYEALGERRIKPGKGVTSFCLYSLGATSSFWRGIIFFYIFPAKLTP